jgi:hypothetical protein
MAWITAGNGSRTSPEKLKPGLVQLGDDKTEVGGRAGEEKGRVGEIPTEDGIDNMIG